MNLVFYDSFNRRCLCLANVQERLSAMPIIRVDIIKDMAMSDSDSVERSHHLIRVKCFQVMWIRRCPGEEGFGYFPDTTPDSIHPLDQGNHNVFGYQRCCATLSTLRVSGQVRRWWFWNNLGWHNLHKRCGVVLDNLFGHEDTGCTKTVSPTNRFWCKQAFVLGVNFCMTSTAEGYQVANRVRTTFRQFYLVMGV